MRRLRVLALQADPIARVWLGMAGMADRERKQLQAGSRQVKSVGRECAHVVVLQSTLVFLHGVVRETRERRRSASDGLARRASRTLTRADGRGRRAECADERAQKKRKEERKANGERRRANERSLPQLFLPPSAVCVCWLMWCRDWLAAYWLRTFRVHIRPVRQIHPVRRIHRSRRIRRIRRGRQIRRPCPARPERQREPS